MAQAGRVVVLLLAVLGVVVATTEEMSVGDDATAVAQAALGAFSCQWTAPTGAQFDLSPLALPGGDYLGADPEPAIWNYKLNFCGRSNAGSGCTELDGAICRLDKQTGIPNMIFGSYVTSPPPTYALLASGNPADGLMLTFTNGQRCDGLSASDRTVILHLLCGSSQTERFVVTTRTGKCTYGIDFTSPHACPISGSGGLSGGSVFLIILLVSTFVYVAGGCFYKRKQLGTTGMESCPNYAQWQQLPGLVADGWRFTKSKVCKSGGGDGANLL